MDGLSLHAGAVFWFQASSTIPQDIAYARQSSVSQSVAYVRVRRGMHPKSWKSLIIKRMRGMGVACLLNIPEGLSG